MGTSLRPHVPRTPGMCLFLKDFKHRSDMARFAFEQDAGELVRSLLQGSRREMKVAWTMMLAQQTEKK